MHSTRTISTWTGSLLVAATVAAVAAAAVLPTVTAPDYLVTIATHHDQTAAAALLYLLAAGTSVGIAIALYPLLARTSMALALGAVVFRTIEAVFYTAAVVSLMFVTTLSERFATASNAARPAIQTAADYAMTLRDQATLAGVFALCVATFMYSWAFYRSQLVPRWLSTWGLVGAALFGTGCVAALFRDEAITGYYPLFLPIAIWEMVLAVRLLVMGVGRATDSTDIAISVGANAPRG